MIKNLLNYLLGFIVYHCEEEDELHWSPNDEFIRQESAVHQAQTIINQNITT